MVQTEKKRDFKVLAEKISPENVLIMSELLAIKETKTLIRFMSRHAVIAHAKLCKDVFCKDTQGYVLSDCRPGSERGGFSLRTLRRISGRFPVFLETREKDHDKNRMLPDRNQNVMQEILLYAEIYKP